MKNFRVSSTATGNHVYMEIEHCSVETLENIVKGLKDRDYKHDGGFGQPESDIYPVTNI